MKRLPLILACMFTLLSCAPKQGKAVSGDVRPFVEPSIPAMISEPLERANYIAGHFWDDFFAGNGPTDTALVLGTRRTEVESAFSNYIALLGSLDKKDAQKYLDSFFTGLESRQAADTSNHVFPIITDLLYKYLYDPNSPFRDEDLYLPVAGRLARSPYTLEEARAGYEFEERMCMLNPYGSQAPDFSITLADGRTVRIHGIKAGLTLLFFSNPGCNACGEIMEALTSRPYLDDFISEGRLAVVSIYIDDELDKWREYEPGYPRNWISGYDSAHVIRTDSMYYVRAIPSLYLLDADKRIILKDAPVERVIDYIENN